jgi:hypothetical protein
MTVASRQLLVEGLEEHLRVVKQLELAFELSLYRCYPHVSRASERTYGVLVRERWKCSGLSTSGG